MFFFSNPWLVADIKKAERDNEDGHKAKKRQEIFILDPRSSLICGLGSDIKKRN